MLAYEMSSTGEILTNQRCRLCLDENEKEKRKGKQFTATCPLGSRLHVVGKPFM